MLIVAFLPLCLGLGVYAAPDGSLPALTTIFEQQVIREDDIVVFLGDYVGRCYRFMPPKKPGLILLTMLKE